MTTQVAFRLEANFNVGMGHFYRCQVLMSALIKEHYAVSLFVSEDSMQVARYISKLINIITIPNFESEEEDANWIVDNKDNIIFDYFIVDNYKFSKVWENTIYSISKKVVVIDDLANRYHTCDYLIDFGFNRTSGDYKYLIPETSKVLVGSEYFIIRQQFLDHISESSLIRKETKSIRNILVSIGATDPKMYTFEIINNIKKINPDISITVLTTNLNNNIDTLKNHIKGMDNVKLYVDVEDVALLLINVDFCVGSLGGSAFERIFLGLPSLCIITEKNQINNAKSLLSLNVIKQVNTEEYYESLEEYLKPGFMREWHEMSNLCLKTFDGLGVHRILNSVFDISPLISLMPMTNEHCLQLYEWQCENGNRKFSRNNAIPSLEEHKKWYKTSLDLSTRLMWIVVFNGISCGYVRLDSESDEIEEISILISQKFRRMGIAFSALDALKKKSKKSKLLASVSPNNIASKKLFIGSGFVQVSVDTYFWSGV